MKRNEEEFTDIVERYKAVIYKVCSVYADDREEMADYYQEVLANLWRSYASFRGESSLSTWIYRVALYTCVSSCVANRRVPAAFRSTWARRSTRRTTAACS